MAEDAFNHHDRANELYLWGVLQNHQVMDYFVKENFTGHPKFHPQMVMFILETILEGFSVSCPNGIYLPLTV